MKSLSPRVPYRRSSIVTSVVLLMAVSVFLLSAPVGAHDDGSGFHMEHHCSTGQVCLFEATNYDHSYAGWTGNILNYYLILYHAADDGHLHRVNDTATSMDNDGVSCGSRHFVNADHSGTSYWLARGVAIADLSLTTLNNKLSSHRWCS